MTANPPLVSTTHTSYGGESASKSMPHANLLLAIVNPLSGERSAAEAVRDAFTSVLGPDRVFCLDANVFRDPSGLRTTLLRRASEHVALYARRNSRGHSDGTGGIAEPLDDGVRQKPSVLVAGGDGTVAFVMDIVQEAFANPTSTAAVPVAAKDVDDRSSDGDLPSVLHLGGPAADGAKSPMSPASPTSREEMAERTPSIAVFPMGTGNDLSYTLGFGLGFTRNHGCAACVCCPRDIEAILSATLAAPVVRFDRWQATISRVGAGTTGAESAVLKRVGFNNYVSFGMDADIARRFDESRKSYPALHRFRTMNKLWYGLHGLTATPCAPKFSNRNVAVTVDNTAAPLPNSAKNCKALVISNVLGYSGGVDLWRLNHPTLVDLPRQAPGGRGVEQRSVPLQPGAIGDGRLEIQTLGGLFHMTFLRSGCVGADRVGQGTQIDVVVSDPDGTQKGVRLQADGEPLGEFSVPFRLQVRPAPRGPIFVHSAPASIATARSATSAVAY